MARHAPAGPMLEGSNGADSTRCKADCTVLLVAAQGTRAGTQAGRGMGM